MITIPSSVSTALASSSYRTALLADLPGTGFRVTDNHRAITYASQTYSTTSEMLLETSSVNRTQEISASSYTLTFAGADRDAYQEYYTNSHIGKSATLYLAFLDDDFALLDAGSVVQIYTGIVDSWDLTETATSSKFQIKLNSHWASFELVNSRFTNSASQKEYYSDDEFFKYSFQEELPIKWGS